MRSPIAHAAPTFCAFFDRSIDVEIEGVVTDIFWRNPHIGLTLEVVNEAGQTEGWELEGGTTNTLMRRGFTAESVKIGDHIRAAGAGSRRGELAIFVSPNHSVALGTGFLVTAEARPVFLVEEIADPLLAERIVLPPGMLGFHC